LAPALALSIIALDNPRLWKSLNKIDVIGDLLGSMRLYKALRGSIREFPITKV
jgi:hypothetical protein